MSILKLQKLFLTSILLCSCIVYAWEEVGYRTYVDKNSGGSSVTMTYTSAGQLYLLYSAVYNSNYPVMQRYIESDNSWITIDTSFFQNQFTSPVTQVKWGRISGDAASDTESSNIYFAYQDILYQSGKASVAKYNVKTNTWSYVGKRGFSDGPIGYMWMQVKRGITPYVLFPDINYMNKLSMMMFNGESWQYLGKRGFSSAYDGIGGAAFTFDSSNGQPYVIFSTMNDANYPSGSARVMTYVNESWVDVGNPSTGWGANQDRIAVDPASHHVYIAYEDGSFINVKMYDGESWTMIGSRMSNGHTLDDSFWLDPENNLYLAFVDGTVGSGTITSKKYNPYAKAWTVVDQPQFSAPASEVTGAWQTRLNRVLYAYPQPYYNNVVAVMMSSSQVAESAAYTMHTSKNKYKKLIY